MHWAEMMKLLSFDEAINITPNNAQPWYGKAGALQKMGKVEEAKRHQPRPGI